MNFNLKSNSIHNLFQAIPSKGHDCTKKLCAKSEIFVNDQKRFSKGIQMLLGKWMYKL